MPTELLSRPRRVLRVRSSVALALSAVLLAACSDTTAPTAAGPSPSDAAPSQYLTVSRVLRYTQSCVGTTCTFDASASSGYTTYGWRFGDGTSASGLKVTHTYPAANASYMLSLIGTSVGASATVRKIVYCSNGVCF
jgi:hypothetical protein